MESITQLYNKLKPFLAAFLLQLGYAGMAIVSKFALNKGMSQRVFVVYRHAIATVVIAPFAIALDRNIRPKLTFSVFVKIALIGLIEPVMDQNLYYTGMKMTTATFATAICNVLPAFSFAMAWILGLEKVYLRRLRGMAKVLGTIVTVGGAMFMTLVNGPMLNLPWTHGNGHQESTSAANNQDVIKGALMMLAGCVCWSAFIILQAITLKSYPAELSLTVLICLMGTLESSILAVAMEWGNPTAWSIHLDSKLLAAVYAGVVCSGFTIYIQGLIMKQRGPVFVVIGAIIIFVGLYLVLWGKSKDQLGSKSDNEKILPTAQNVATMDERIMTSNQEFRTINLNMSMESRTQLYKKVKPFVAIILVQLGHAGMSIIGKFALNKGMNPRVFIAYRYAVATVVIAPFAIFYDSLEKVNIRRRASQAKVLGTIVSFGGVMLMTLVKGPSWNLPWTYGHSHQESASAAHTQVVVKGSLMMLAESTIVALAIERRNLTAWSRPLDIMLVAVGILPTAFSIYIYGMNRDQPLKSGAEKVVPTVQNTATADERMPTSNHQEFTAINMTSEKSTDGTA
ncbi:wat1-related protein [Quercus suber]|uniref:Wat1-related protein n=1 Tax=Quercus suber TaxID=58331 RepID=A0AAW0KGQ3_QUESU